MLVLGAPDDAETVRAAVALGARGYLRWDASPLELGLGLSRTGMRPECRPPAAGAAAARSAARRRDGRWRAVARHGRWGGASPLAGAAPTTVRSTVPETPQVAPVDA